MAYTHILYGLILDRFIATLQETNTQFLDAVLSGSIKAVSQHSRFASLPARAEQTIFMVQVN